MTKLLIHMALPSEKRSVGGTLESLSGRLDEHSVPLIPKTGGASEAKDSEKGYTSKKWFGASHAFIEEVAQKIVASITVKGSDSFYSLYDERGKGLISTNLATEPKSSSFEHFLEEAGLEIELVDIKF